MCLSLLVLGLAYSGVEAQPVYFESPDAPANLPDPDGDIFVQWDIALNDAGSYDFAATLPDRTFVDAVDRLADCWLLSLKYKVARGDPLPGSTSPNPWDPRDVFCWYGGNDYRPYEGYTDAVGWISSGSNVDAAFLDPTGAVVVSFDVPTTIELVTYEPSDLVRFDPALRKFDAVPYFDASAAGIPISSNLISADRRGLLTVFSLDETTTIAGTEGLQTFLHGQLVSWDGQQLAVFDPQPGWPDNAKINAIAFEVASETGAGSIGDSLRIGRQAPDELRLTWAASDCAGASNTAVYQGTLASLRLPEPEKYDHHQIVCNDAFPFLQEVIDAPVEDDAYFLVVALNGVPQEGSYGVSSDMIERPAAEDRCAQDQAPSCSVAQTAPAQEATPP